MKAYDRDFPYVVNPQRTSLYEKACIWLFYLILLLDPIATAWLDRETGGGIFLPKFILLFGILSIPLWKIFYRYWTKPIILLTFFFLFAGAMDFVRLGKFNGDFLVPVRQALVGVYFTLVGYNLIRHDSRNIKRLAFAILFGAVFSAFFAAMGIGAKAGEQTLSGERIAVLGQNANATSQAAGRMIVFALLVLGRLIRLSFMLRLLTLISVPICLFAMVRVASRGGLAALILTLPFLIFVTRSFSKKLLYFFLIGFAGALLTATVLMSGVLRDRIISTIEDGDTGGREGLFWAAIEAWQQAPLCGNGYSLYRFEMQAIRGHPLPLVTHNSYVMPLVASGLVGASFYFLAYSILLVHAWRNRQVPYGNFAFLLMVSVVFIGMVGNIEYSRPLFMAYGLNEGIYWQSVVRWKVRGRRMIG